MVYLQVSNSALTHIVAALLLACQGRWCWSVLLTGELLQWSICTAVLWMLKVMLVGVVYCHGRCENIHRYIQVLPYKET